MTSPYTIPPDVSLIPVLEFVPVRFSNGTHKLPPYPVSDEDCHIYWLNCLEDSGIVGLQPITLREWHVAVEQLTDARILELLVHAHMAALPLDNDIGELILAPDDAGALNGGYAFCIDGEVLVTPQCCSDMSDISSWEMAAEYRAAGDETVWIGHPWIQVRFECPALVFTNADAGEPVLKARECIVAPGDLRQAVDRAKREIELLAERLTPVVEKFAPAGRALETARILAGVMW